MKFTDLVEGFRYRSEFNGDTFTVFNKPVAKDHIQVVWDSNKRYIDTLWRHHMRPLQLSLVVDRCKCKHGRRRCVLSEHDGSIVAHQVQATGAERKAGKHTDGFYGWNTGRVYPLAALDADRAGGK
jgi:hypothetical protein